MSHSISYSCQELLTNLNNANFCTKNILENSLFPTFQNEECVSVTIQFINKLLTTAENRLRGLELLNKVLSSLPIQTVVDNVLVWSKIILNFSSQEEDNAFRYDVLAKLLEMKLNNQDFNKAMVTAIPKIIDLCLAIRVNSDLNRSSLKCLTACLQRYPNTCGPYKKKIELYLCKYLSNSLPVKTVQQAGTAFHFLQQAGGSGPDIYAHRNNWTSSVYKLCSTLNEQYQEFFANITEFANYSKTDDESFKFENDERDSIQESPLVYVTANRIKNIVTFLNSLLLEEYSTEKVFSVQIIFDVIRRGLTIDTYADYCKSFESIQFTALLYDHQIDLLYLLRSLILCIKQNIMPFSFIITKLLMDCLKRTQKDYFKLSIKYQEAVYAVLNQWISLSKNKFCKTVHNKLVSFILLEISYTKEDVKLTTNAPKKSKKRKELASNSIDTTSSTTQHYKSTKEQLCVEGLKCGSYLLNNVALQLDSAVYKQLSETVIQNVMNLQKGNSKPPYPNLKCQIYLYEMLVSIFNQPYFCVKPYLPTAINLFVEGTKGNNYEIVSICNSALNNLEKSCQATCPILNQGHNPVNNFITDTAIEQDFVSAISAFYDENKSNSDAKSPSNENVADKETSAKINILSNQVIKPSTFEVAKKANGNDIAALVKQVNDTKVRMEEDAYIDEIENITIDEMEFANQEDTKTLKLDEDDEMYGKENKKIKLDDNLQEHSLEVRGVILDDCKKLNKDEILVNGIQKENGDVEENHEVECDEDVMEMLNSFHDVVNEF